MNEKKSVESSKDEKVFHRRAERNNKKIGFGLPRKFLFSLGENQLLQKLDRLPHFTLQLYCMMNLLFFFLLIINFSDYKIQEMGKSSKIEISSFSVLISLG